MALLAAGSPLVAGGAAEDTMQNNAKPATRWVRVARPFYFNRSPLKPGELVELQAAFAAECIAAGKAEPASAPEAKPQEGKKGAAHDR